MPFTFQYVSDIHLEMHKSYQVFRLKPFSKNVALCGDIGWPHMPNYRAFILQCARDFENVFVLFGNHEYYSNTNPVRTMTETKKSVSWFPKNVYFLDNASLFVNKRTNVVETRFDQKKRPGDWVKIIGSTLWTQVNSETPKLMNDYSYIYTRPQTLLTWQEVAGWNAASVKYILKELDKHPNVESVLLTHHAPHASCMNPKKNVPSAYINNIPELYMRNNLVACVSGHTHKSAQTTIKFPDGHSIEFLSNQYGYPGESKEDVGYNPSAVYHVK